ncbi:MAG: M23 family metallopeptidase [Bacillota bacterium]|nr:M23 family metallopeptidase [Bacillota bacterium]
MDIIYDQGLEAKEYRLLLGSRDDVRVYDVFPCVVSMVWETKRAAGPAKLVFTLLKTEGMAFWEGDKVRLMVGGENLFTGYVFAKEKNHLGEISVICFDQLRYLRARQSYNFTGQSPENVIKKIAGDFGLNCGTLAATGYTIPSFIVDSQTCLDTIYQSLELTTAATGRSYCFYDDGGRLRLRSSTEMVSPYILGEDSFAESYSYATTINDGVYNSVKLVRPNDITGLGDAYVARSEKNIRRWGLLQHYQRVNMDMNPAEIREQAKTMLLRANRPGRVMTMTCIGIDEIRAGQVLKIILSDMGDIAMDQFLTVDEAVHRWDEQGHTMDLAFSIFPESDIDYAYGMAEYSEYINVVKKEPSSGSSGSNKKSSASDGGGSSDGSYRMPFHGTYRISTQFGKKGKAWKCGWHTGVDYVGISDKNVYAICAGTVTFAGTKASYGKCVYVKHIDGYLSVYAHLSSISVSAGQSVTTGTRLGREGQTGNASGSHLHLELHKGSYKYPPNPAINPNVYILTHK